MRDLVIEEDLCQSGWEKWEKKRVGKRSTTGKKRGNEGQLLYAV